jgi:hypothetical protein
MVVPKILNFPCYHHLNYLKLCRCPVSGGAGSRCLLETPGWSRSRLSLASATAVARVVLRGCRALLGGWRRQPRLEVMGSPKTPVTSLRGPKSSPRKELPGSSPKFSDASYFQYASKMQLGILFMSTSTLCLGLAWLRPNLRLGQFTRSDGG